MYDADRRSLSRELTTNDELACYVQHNIECSTVSFVATTGEEERCGESPFSTGDSPHKQWLSPLYPIMGHILVTIGPPLDYGDFPRPPIFIWREEVDSKLQVQATASTVPKRQRPTEMNSAIKITSDARFRLARSLMTNGGGSGGDDDDSSLEGAIDIFASLLEECRRSSGETSVDAALCHYEYGNALFRAVVRRTEQSGGGSDEANEKDGDKKTAAKPPPIAAEAVKSATTTGKRSLDDNIAMQSDSVPSNKRIKTTENIENCNDDGDDSSDEDDVSLALEMLSTSFGIFDWHVSDATTTTTSEEEREFALAQIPRVLNCIGDIHSHRKQFGNAVDAYCRALPYRENNASKKKHHATKNNNNEEGEGGCLSVEELTCQRQLVETYALVAEALLACKEGEDVVCIDDDDDEEDDDAGLKKDEKKAKKSIVLVSARDRIEFAQSHYETAKEKLQEIGTCDLRFV